MAKHQLFLNFPEHTNEGILRIEDSSIYAAAPSPSGSCFTLEVTPPGYTSPTVITGLLPKFELFLNACQIGIQILGCDDTCPVIQDGIYHIRYSVSPNSLVFVEYNMFRTIHFVNKWYKTLCWVNDIPAAPMNDTLVLIRELQLIQAQVLTARHLCEDLHDYEVSMEMYRYAYKRLQDLSRGCSTCQ